MSNACAVLTAPDRILNRYNAKEKMELKKFQILDIAPSMSLDALAGQHAEEMPKALKLALGGGGNAAIQALAY